MTNGLLQLIVVNEAHFINQSGRHFRPEFLTAVRYLGHLIRLMPRRVPRVLMSATLLKSDIDLIIKLMEDMEPQVLHGPLDRRTIAFKVFVSGRGRTTLKKSAKYHFKKRPKAQQIWYTNSRTKAEGSLWDLAEELLHENRTRSEDLPWTPSSYTTILRARELCFRILLTDQSHEGLRTTKKQRRKFVCQRSSVLLPLSRQRQESTASFWSLGSWMV